MNSEHERTHIERAERWAAMEWILVGGRRWCGEPEAGQRQDGEQAGEPYAAGR